MEGCMRAAGENEASVCNLRDEGVGHELEAVAIVADAWRRLVRVG